MATAFRTLLQSRRDGGPRGVLERALQALEAAALRAIETFEAHVGNNPLRGRHVQGAGSVHMRWANATMGREHGAGVMRVLERKAEAVAGTFNAQDVANTLWAYAASNAMVAVSVAYGGAASGEPWARLRASIQHSCARSIRSSWVAALSRGFVWRRSTT